MTENVQRWTNVDAGPIQAKRVEKALSALRWEKGTEIHLTGVVGRPETERRSAMTSMFLGARDQGRKDVAKALQSIGEQFGWQVTKANHREIIEAAETALATCQAARPVVDERRTAEDADHGARLVAEREAGYQAQRDAHKALADEALAKAPAGAAAIIVAELKHDTSDPMTDYFSNKAVRVVGIGWRFGSREDFRQLRAAAGRFPDTAGLGPDAPKDIEHRDNYSMGRGNYLSDHGWDGSGSGWVVRSSDIKTPQYWGLTELALPETETQHGEPVVSSDGVTVRPSSIGREGVVEVVFDSKPDPDVIAGLKSHGFRWARGNQCWYGRDAAYAESLVGSDQA